MAGPDDRAKRQEQIRQLLGQAVIEGLLTPTGFSRTNGDGYYNQGDGDYTQTGGFHDQGNGSYNQQ